MSMESLYQELILEHSKRPHHAQLSESGDHTARSHQRNPVCGDEITLQVRVSDDGTTVPEVTWEGSGCSISQASASMLATLVDGQDRAAVLSLIDGFREALRSRGTVELDEDVYEDAAALGGVSRYTARVKCAMLAWVALEDALARAE